MFDFKEMIGKDLDIFLNLDEYGEPHEVDGKTVQSILDNDALKDKAGGENSGLSSGNLQLFAKSADLPDRKGYGESINIDGVDYLIEEWEYDMGLAVVTISKTVV